MNIISKVKYNKDNEKTIEDATMKPVSIDNFIHKKKVEPISRKVYYPYFESIFGLNKYILKNTNLNFLHLTNTNLNFLNINIVFEMKPGQYHSFSFIRLHYHFHRFINASNILSGTNSRYSIKEISYKK